MTSVTVGYLTELGGRVVPLPVMQIVLMLDADTGEPIEGYDFFEVDDSIDGFVIPSFEGTVYVNNGALASSTISTTAPLFGWDELLPEGVSIMQPIGGLQAFAPVQGSSGGGCSVHPGHRNISALLLLLLPLALIARHQKRQNAHTNGV